MYLAPLTPFSGPVVVNEPADLFAADGLEGMKVFPISTAP
jgi:hypothetical protein